MSCVCVFYFYPSERRYQRFFKKMLIRFGEHSSSSLKCHQKSNLAHLMVHTTSAVGPTRLTSLVVPCNVSAKLYPRCPDCTRMSGDRKSHLEVVSQKALGMRATLSSPATLEVDFRQISVAQSDSFQPK